MQLSPLYGIPYYIKYQKLFINIDRFMRGSELETDQEVTDCAVLLNYWGIQFTSLVFPECFME